MRRRLICLLVLLGVVSITALFVGRLRERAALAQKARINAAIQRYSELEAEANHHEETTWRSLQVVTAADAWWTTSLDTVMAAPNNWTGLLSFLGNWPGLDALKRELTRDQTTGWQLSRATVRPQASPAESTRPGQSLHQLEILLSRGDDRAVIQAVVAFHSSPAKEGDPVGGDFVPRGLDLLDHRRSEGRIQFRPWAEFTLAIPTNTFFADPLLYRQTSAGPELIMVSTSQRWRWESTANSPAGGWKAVSMLEGIPRDRALAAALADFDSDGWSDLCLAGRDGFWVARGTSNSFEKPSLRWRGPEPLIHPQSLTLADIDHDGDLDIWITQYKNPYQKGQFPTPYYDANDGFNSYLLRNDGAAGFTDITVDSGLDSKRRRRSYSATLMDINGDGAPDLVNVSDFAGVDVYHNDGTGHFKDVTHALAENHFAFGMAHAVIDWNGDAFPDLLVVGMDSPWASRLDSLNLGRPDFAEHQRKRAAMTWGNRMFLGSASGLQAESSPASTALAKVGWGWSGVELDVENDGRSDFFFATGHETRASQRDYERQFWLHDIYAAGSTNDAGAELYFQAAHGRRRADNASYGGWQHQALMRSSGTNGFVESSWLSGVGVLADGRNALAADFDGDGRVDLALTTVEGWPEVRQRLLIFHNDSANSGHWVGFRFREGLGRRSGVNTRIEIETESGVRRRWLVTGENYRSQQTVEAHFGLGAGKVVRKAAVIWSDGSKKEFDSPSIDQWHEVP